MGHLSTIPIKDLCQLLKRRTPRLNIEEIDEAELDKDPDRVDEGEIPVVR
jgi:hypothetical protein